MNQHSEQIDLVAAAIVKAQRTLRAVGKTAENPHFKSRFAPLEEIMSAAKEALNAQGVAILQGTGDEDAAGFNLVTTLLHESGQWVAGRIRMPLDKGTAQAAGSAITYAKRYGLAALVGIVAEDDDDGNAATAAQTKAKRAAPVPASETPKKKLTERTEVELLELRRWADSKGKPDLVEKIDEEFERRRESDDFSQLPPELVASR